MFRSAAILLGLVVSLWVNAVSAEALVSHRAIYGISLRSADNRSGITGVRGAMLYRFADSCDGWTVENRTYMRLQYAEGAEVESTWSFASWESKDGKDYRFNVRHARDGDVVEALQGTASVDGEKGGRAIFSQPKNLSVDLPPGTLLPTRHLRLILEAAAAGTPRLVRPVFDGSSLDNPFHISMVTGKQPPAAAKPSAASRKLPAKPSWWMRLAFFPVAGLNPEPEFEIGVDYRADGIGDYIIQDFGDFVLGLTPSAIEVLPKPDC